MDLTATGTPITPTGRMIEVVVHSPANNNDFASRPSYASILARSPFFQQRMRELTSIDLPVLHIIAELEHYDIVADWLCTNNVRTRDGSLPDLYTLVMVIFLADTLQLTQLSTQIVNLMRMQQYASGDVSRKLPGYFEIYQKTTVGNPLRSFVVEAYVNNDMNGTKTRVPLVDLPAAVLVDIIQFREGRWSSGSQKTFEERLAKAGEELKVESEKRFKEREVELVQSYKEKLSKAKEAVARLSKTVEAGAASASTVFHPPSVQTPGSASIGSALLEDIKKGHEKLMDETKKKNDERYNNLVEVMRQRNSEHLEAVQIMDKATQIKEARLMREIEELRKFKEESVSSGQSATEEYIKEIANLRSIIKSKEETDDIVQREIGVLQKGIEKARAASKPPETQNVPLLVKNIEELKKTIILLKRANEDLKKANNDLEEDAGRHYSELAELKRVYANTEERNRRQLDSLHKKVDENAQKYRKDVEGLQTKLKENSDAYKKELARLKKANKELLDQLTVGEDDDL